MGPFFSVRAISQFTLDGLSFNKDQTALPETGRCCLRSNFAKFMWQGARKREQWDLALQMQAQTG